MNNRFVIIVAGGKGLRMGSELPKQFIPIQGKPLLMHTLEKFHHWDSSTKIILVLPQEHQDYWRMLCKEIGCNTPHFIVDGGETRFHSVKNGLACISSADSLVAVHDGVRPFVSREVIGACFAEAAKRKAVVPVVNVVETIRNVTPQGSRTVPRDNYKLVQTPQVFTADLLKQAYGQPYNSSFTDDASVVEAFGVPVCLVPGNRENIKLTTPFDLKIAEALV